MPKVSMKLRGDGSTVFIWLEDMVACTISRTMPSCRQFSKCIFESGKIVSAICHGVCGLLNVGLSDGQLLVAGKKITGFSWFEETLARRKKVVPFDLEAVLKERGADYRKAWIPMTSKVVVDGTLITGQNPLSSKEMAKVVLNHLTKREIR